MDNTTTERKIGKTTYLVTASPSDKATDTIAEKIEKLIIKGMRQDTGLAKNEGYFSREL